MQGEDEAGNDGEENLDHLRSIKDIVDYVTAAADPTAIQDLQELQQE